jgi:hypothetical protein
MRTRKHRKRKDAGNNSFNNRQEKPQPFFSPLLQPKLAIGKADDPAEKEAVSAAGAILNSENAVQLKADAISGGIAAPPIVNEALSEPGESLDGSTKDIMSARLDHDFSDVQVHNNDLAHESAAAIDALAFTQANHIVFGKNQYEPDTITGKKLLAHELTHVKQQQTGNAKNNVVQKADLKSPRLAGNTLFEDVLDNKNVIEYGQTGSEVRRIQQLLIDLGILLPTHGVDGIFKTETINAVKKFQKRKKLHEDGRVGFRTIAALDKEFPAVSLPAKKSDPWTMSCILEILCGWNKYLVEKVLTTYSVTTFDSREYPTEKWDGTKWVKGKMEVGGYHNKGSKELGLLNKVTCEEMAFIIYHEGFHALQPAKLTGRAEKEKNAYIIGEQWSIDIGLPGRSDFTNEATKKTESFRTTTGSTTEVNEAAAETFVKQEYGGVSSLPGEFVLERDGATNVKVRKADGTEYIRAAKVGESVTGTPVTAGVKSISKSDWVCP